MSHAIRFHHVHKRYRLGVYTGSLRSTLASLLSRNREEGTTNIWALKDVSFEIAPGESVGLVGPNGAGKSTTLRLIAGITRPTSGEISVNGRVSTLLELGAGFHPELTGRENIFLYGSILGLSRREVQKAFDSIVAFSELERFLDTPLKRYSSGMYVRLAFAVAAHVYPDILLVDEVLAVGDAGFRQKCMDRMAELLQAGTTLLFVSHSSHMVQTVCQRAIYLRGGKLIKDGESSAVLRMYEHDLRRARTIAAQTTHEADDVSSEALEITDISVLDLQGRHREAFEYFDGAKIQVRYRAHTPVERPILHIRLFRDDGVACFTVRSNQPNAQLTDITLAGEGEFALRIEPLQLYGGAYRAQVAITDRSNAAVMARGHSPWFQVDGPGNIDIANERLGIYVPYTAWEVNGRIWEPPSPMPTPLASRHE